MYTRQAMIIGICALAAAGCSGLQETPSGSWKVEPDAAIRHGGMDAPSMYLIGRHFHNQGRYELAVTAYRDALRSAAPALATQVRNAVAVTYAAQGRYDMAIQELKEAVAAEPALVYLQSNLGYAYLLRGDNEQARRVLEQAARLDPHHQGTRRHLRTAISRTARQSPGDASGAAAAAPLPTSAAATGPVAPAARPSDLSPRTARDARITLDAVSPGVYELREPARAAVPAAPIVPVSAPLGSAEEAKPYRLEVANGNGVGGLARRVAERLKTLGVPTVRLTNQVPPHAITEVQYAQGYAAEAARLAAALNHRALMVSSAKLRRDIHVRLVLGGDSRSVVALFEPAPAHARGEMVAVSSTAGR